MLLETYVEYQWIGEKPGAPWKGSTKALKTLLSGDTLDIPGNIAHRLQPVTSKFTSLVHFIPDADILADYNLFLVIAHCKLLLVMKDLFSGYNLGIQTIVASTPSKMIMNSAKVLLSEIKNLLMYRGEIDDMIEVFDVRTLSETQVYEKFYKHIRDANTENQHNTVIHEIYLTKTLQNYSDRISATEIKCTRDVKIFIAGERNQFQYQRFDRMHHFITRSELPPEEKRAKTYVWCEIFRQANFHHYIVPHTKEKCLTMMNQFLAHLGDFSQIPSNKFSLDGLKSLSKAFIQSVYGNTMKDKDTQLVIGSRILYYIDRVAYSFCTYSSLSVGLQSNKLNDKM
uniref:Uncharacterized protein n=1 Tax=Tetranychus urticae TaxID=32264 RepID=T1L4I3_TETUR